MNAPSLQGIEWEGDFFAGSKKAHMKKILLACNTLTAISADAYRDHASLYYHLGKDFPKFQFQQFFSRRLSIDRFRNTAFRFAIDLGIDYLFFIDDDMQFHHTVFKQLYEGCEKKGYDILAALNYIRGYPFDPMAFSFQTNVNGKRQLLHLSDEVINESAGGILKCDAIGTAVCLIKMKNVKTVPPAWFVTGPHNTEDIYFCLKCKDYSCRIIIEIRS